MRSIWVLLSFIIADAAGSTINTVPATFRRSDQTSSQPCHYNPTECHLHGSNNYGKVQVYKCANKNNSIVCLSSSLIRWVSGWTSEKVGILLSIRRSWFSDDNYHTDSNHHTFTIANPFRQHEPSILLESNRDPVAPNSERYAVVYNLQKGQRKNRKWVVQD